MGFGEPFLGLRGGRLTALITVAAATDMTLFGKTVLLVLHDYS